MTARRKPPAAKRRAAAPSETPPSPPPSGPVTRRDHGIGAVIGLGAFVLYLVTLCPTIFVEDSAEFSTAAGIFGVPHPPGYPLYTLLAGLFVRVLPVGDIAYRSNLFSAACGAAAIAVLWLLLRRLGVGRLGALVATMSFAVGETFWSESLAAEVHSLNVVLLVLALLFTVEAVQAPSARRYAWAGLTIGLAVGHRNINSVFLAPLVVVLELERRKQKRDPRLILVALGALVASAAVYLYLPIAASRDPALNMGEPTSFPRLWSVITAHAYMRHLQTASLATDLGGSRTSSPICRSTSAWPSSRRRSDSSSFTGEDRAGSCCRSRGWQRPAWDSRSSITSSTSPRTGYRPTSRSRSRPDSASMPGGENPPPSCRSSRRP